MKKLPAHISLQNVFPVKDESRMNFASRSIVMLTGLLCVAGLLFICATPIQEVWNNYDLIFAPSSR